jgi:hypothetical protein
VIVACLRALTRCTLVLLTTACTRAEAPVANGSVLEPHGVDLLRGNRWTIRRGERACPCTPAAANRFAVPPLAHAANTT